ncbi:MAG: hypothetical protein ACFB22_04775 [Rhodothalassiaceae bacterium]
MPADRGLWAPAQGFVLPWVLVFILVVAALALIGVRAAERGQTLVRSIESRQAAERALQSSEHRVLFQWLTAQPVSGGIDLAAAPQSQRTTGLEGLPKASASENVWRADGGVRRDSNGVLIRYQDSVGLASLNRARPEDLAWLLQRFGVAEPAAEQLAARLADYNDADRVRRFQGAEAPEYRLHRRGAPSNSPLRAHQELAQVLGWDAYRSVWTDPAFIDATTVEARNFVINDALMPAALKRRLAGPNGAVPFGNDGGIAQAFGRSPGPRARFVLSIGFEGLNGPQRLMHVVEVERRPDALDLPFYRYFIDDRQLDSANDPNGDSPPLFPADPPGAQR